MRDVTRFRLISTWKWTEITPFAPISATNSAIPSVASRLREATLAPRVRGRCRHINQTISAYTVYRKVIRIVWRVSELWQTKLSTFLILRKRVTVYIMIHVTNSQPCVCVISYKGLVAVNQNHSTRCRRKPNHWSALVKKVPRTFKLILFYFIYLFIAFRVSRRRSEMYSGHARLSVCLYDLY